MPDHTRVVFCITCKGRAQHIEKTLPRNLADNPGALSRFVLLDYNSPDHLVDYLQSRHREAIECGKLVVYGYRGQHSFRMAHAKNMAHRLGIMEGGDILVNLDADNFTGPRFDAYIAHRFTEQERMFLWSRMIKDERGRLPRGISGRIAVTKQAFMVAGGYNEKFETWSPDDKDFNARLRRLGYRAEEIDTSFLNAILHNDKMRFREYKHAKTMLHQYDFEAVDGCTDTVVNFGHIGEGIVYRNFGEEPITLGPLPTRVFGIGLHKTATTSLDKALKILEFDSAHWKSAHWARAIWQEMMTEGRSPTLERHYALCDLPIPLLYWQLDQAYPGSRFILTIRAERKWLESVRRHWSHDHNRFRGQWNSDHFTHKIHREIYGQRNFDAELFINRYRRHNEEVQRYFKDRPSDLLVMNMESAGWPELCGFLQQPVPDVAYPKEFTTMWNGQGEGI